MLKPHIQISKALKVWCPLPQALAGILHVLLNLAFLPTRCWITELRIKQVVADHGSEPLIDPALFATPHRIHSGLHVVVDAALGNATEDLKGMPVGIKQHFMFLLVVSPKHKGPAVGQLKLGNLKFDLFARYAGKVLTPIELEGFATSKAQGDETTLARGLRLELFGIFPLSGKGTHSVIRPGKAQSDQIPVHAAQVSAQLLCLFVLGGEPLP
ncbi:Uncharacterised protein [Enterobacter hormaechei]|nr:Uncharacterised protein [Enterobacter hormaechei]STX56433.1 Uncharacterised protein [Klebsiella pneumoniae]